MSAAYTTRVKAVGGRSGRVESEDGILALDLAMPKELGGKGGATNPEQLFAAGYAACFENAVIHATRKSETKIRDEDIVVVGEVGLSPNSSGGFVLSVTLEIEIAGVDQGTANDIVAAAHQICPYSNAVKGNIDVKLKVSTK